MPDGLSPRVRGNHQAGVRKERERVYPRACGGTDSVGLDSFDYPGLSPRVRGNPFPRPP